MLFDRQQVRPPRVAAVERRTPWLAADALATQASLPPLIGLLPGLGGHTQELVVHALDALQSLEHGLLLDCSLPILQQQTGLRAVSRIVARTAGLPSLQRRARRICDEMIADKIMLASIARLRQRDRVMLDERGLAANRLLAATINSARPLSFSQGAHVVQRTLDTIKRLEG